MAEVISIKYSKTHKNESIISANGDWLVPITDRVRRDHKFFNELVITNDSNSKILVTPDHDSDRAFWVIGKSEKAFTFKDDNLKFNQVLITELTGSDIAANSIQVQIMKKRIVETKPGEE